MARISSKLTIVFGSVFCFLVSPTDLHAAPFKLSSKMKQVITVGNKKVTCGLPGSKWVVVKSAGKGKFSIDSKATGAQKRACSALLAKGKLRSLSQLPGINSFTRSSGASAKSISKLDVSGTPPSLIDISDIGVSNVFWRSGVIDALKASAPSQQQCSEFFIGANDGESGGFEACTVAEDVGYAFEPVLRSGVSLCYMKNIPKQKFVDSGAISISAGSLPDGSIENIFLPPVSDASRTIKVAISAGEGNSRTGFIRVNSQASNSAAGSHYRYNLWFCDSQSGELKLRSYETLNVSYSGDIAITSVGLDNYGQYSASVAGRLAVSGDSLVFDQSAERSATVTYQSVSDQNRFKAGITIGTDSLLTQKFLNIYRGVNSNKLSVSQISGDSVQDLKLLAAAFKESLSDGTSQDQNFTGGIEFRDSIYVSAPNNSLVSKVESANFSNDTFYDQVELPEFDDSLYSCTATADVELAMDMTNSDLKEVAENCEQVNKQVNNFCRENDSLRAIQSDYQNLCGSF